MISTTVLSLNTESQQIKRLPFMLYAGLAPEVLKLLGQPRNTKRRTKNKIPFACAIFSETFSSLGMVK